MQSFLSYCTKAQATTEKMINSTSSNLKAFVLKRVKTQLTEWNETFANQLSCKRLVFRICEQLQLVITMQTTQFKNGKRSE